MHGKEPIRLPASAVIFRSPWFAPKGTLDAANSIKAGRFKPYSSTPEWSFHFPIDWAADPFKDNNWMVSLHAFYMLRPLILQYENDADCSHLYAALDIVFDWGRFHYEENRTTRFSFNDFAAGVRCTYMAWLHSALTARCGSAVAQDQLARLADMMNDHVERILDGRVEFRYTNHGLFQIHGLVCVCYVLQEFAARERATQFISGNLRELLAANFDAEFLHREHSPGYHDLATSKLQFFLGSGLYKDYPIIEQTYLGARNNVFWLTDPAGTLYAVGDTSAQKSREASQVGLDAVNSGHSVLLRKFDFGYVSIKSIEATRLREASGLFVQGSFHSSIHKHLDDLTFELFEKGERLLVDSGAYGYQVSLERRYCQSTRAHNTVEINGADFSRKPEHAYGSAIRQAEYRGDHFYIKAHADHPELAASHQREFFYLPGAWLILRDKVLQETPRQIAQWFHLATSCTLIKEESESIIFQASNTSISFVNMNGCVWSIYKGERVPRLQGWCSPSDRVLVANYALGFFCDSGCIDTIVLVDPDKADEAKEFLRTRCTADQLPSALPAGVDSTATPD
jgi:hypothetical protein